MAIKHTFIKILYCTSFLSVIFTTRELQANGVCICNAKSSIYEQVFSCEINEKDCKAACANYTYQHVHDATVFRDCDNDEKCIFGIGGMNVANCFKKSE